MWCAVADNFNASDPTSSCERGTWHYDLCFSFDKGISLLVRHCFFVSSLAEWAFCDSFLKNFANDLKYASKEVINQ